MSDQRRVWRTKAVLMSDLFAPSVKLSSLGTGDCALVLSRDMAQFTSLCLILLTKGLFSNRSWDCHGSGSLAGVLGHFLGGYLADSPTYGRKLTLLFSAGLSILAAVVLALTQTLPMLILVNLIGIKFRCYWTAADAVIDVTPSEHRQKRLHSWL